MGILALTLGTIVGYWLGEKLSDYFLLLYYHRDFRSEDKYLSLYDVIDDEFHFEMLSQSSPDAPKKYSDYLKLHQDMRPKAYKIYRKHIDGIAKHSLLLIVLAIIVPSIAFYGLWYMYFTPILLGLIGHITYKRKVKDYSVDFYAILMMIVILNTNNQL